MLFLLPPSETKTRPADGPVLDLSALSLPELSDARATMLRAVQRTAAGRNGGEALGVPAGSPELVERMQHVDEEPTDPALQVYSGVLYDALGAVTPREDAPVLVQSALFGLVGAADAIPAYRVSAGSKVARLGKAGTWWAKTLKPLGARLLAETADSASPLVIDCRSGAYRSMMPMRSTDAVRVLQVNAVQERDGVRKVVSHDAKRYRGWVTRVLQDAPVMPGTAEEIVDLLRTGFDGTLDVELDGDTLIVVDHPER